MPRLEPDFSDHRHGQIILGAGFVDSSLVEDVGLIETIDLPICGISSLERLLLRNRLNLPTWLHLKSQDKDFESYLKHKFPELIGFSYSSTESEEGLRISALLSIKAASEFFTSIDVVFADTWQDLPESADAVSVKIGMKMDVYTGVKRGKNGKLEFELNSLDPYVTGYFRFSNPQLFLKLLHDQEDNGAIGFYSAISDYDAQLDGGIKLEMANNWYDFGHKKSFYESRRHWLLGRSFNRITASDEANRITKSSINDEKLIQEFNWYKMLPPDLRHYAPQVWEIEGKSSYEIEFFPAPSLAEILVFGNQSLGFWSNTLIEIEKYFSVANKISFEKINEDELNNARREMYIDKVLKRVEGLRVSDEFNKFADFQNPFIRKLSFRERELPKLDEVLDIYVSLVKSEIMTKNQSAKLIHGDFCFGNMICNNLTLKIFDPRGSFGEIKIAGDLYYDYAKLAHSILGEYDFFAFDRFSFSRNKTGYDATPIFKYDSEVALDTLRMSFSEIMFRQGIDPKSVRIIMAGIFLSLASLHKESVERQMSLLLIGMSEVASLAGTDSR